jgi:hypothetical protein
MLTICGLDLGYLTSIRIKLSGGVRRITGPPPTLERDGTQWQVEI